MRLVTLAAALLLTGCGLGPWIETAVLNEAIEPGIVVERTDNYSTYFYAVPPGQTVVVDSVDHENAPATSIAILDASCANRREFPALASGFAEGGLIVVNAQGEMQFTKGRRGRGSEFKNNFETCVEAAATLAD